MIEVKGEHYVLHIPTTLSSIGMHPLLSSLTETRHFVRDPNKGLEKVCSSEKSFIEMLSVFAILLRSFLRQVLSNYIFTRWPTFFVNKPKKYPK